MAEALTKRRSRRGSTPDARERELRRLRLSVCDDVGFRLFVATYDQPKRRDDLIARVTHEAEVEKVRVTRLELADSGPETNLVGLLRSHVEETDLPSGWRQAVMVTGIEQRLDYSGGREGLAFLHQANLLRDALPEAAPMPVVLWLSRVANAALPVEAPDLWDWRAANFDFTGDEAPRTELLRELTTMWPEDDLGLSKEQRQARVNMLEDLLAELEREGPPKSKRQAAERANLLMEIGAEAFLAVRAAEAIPRFERALELLEEISDRRGKGLALGALGAAWKSLGEARSAIECYEQALGIARETGDRRAEGPILAGLGDAWRNLGDVSRAIELYEQALVIEREIADRPVESKVLFNLGNAWADLGEQRRAIGYFEQALAIVREIGDRSTERVIVHRLGVTWRHLGDLRQALGFFEKGLAIAREIGDRQGEGLALGGLSLAWTELGEAHRASGFLKQWLAITRQINDKEGEGKALLTEAFIRAVLGEREEAERRAREALTIFKAIGDEDLVASVRTQLTKWGASDVKASGAPVDSSTNGC